MTGITGVSNIVDASQRTSREKELGKNEFFKILSAQLQFQDPMQGGDNSEYVAQLAQFSALEQMENLNRALADLQANQNLLFGSQLIGRAVQIASGSQIAAGEVQSVRIRDSGLYVVLEDGEYPAEDILDMAAGTDERLDFMAEALDRVKTVLEEAHPQETELQAIPETEIL